ncbi:phosphoserine phosphatase SerB [Terrihabitans sp. B22-R8]|uniref:phosphoserine phosphatase SerB n=1 Tax=Terrihabitans sp. B22-R8 TaxID=3425128 RepID=UPI00403C049F
MLHVVSLITHPDTPVLDDVLLSRLQTELPGAPPWKWLAAGIAAEFEFVRRDGDIGETSQAARQIIGERPVDLNIIPSADRRKRLLLADMDSTMIQQECIDELADLLGLRDEIAAITERAMRGEIAFEPALRERVALLRGLRTEDLSRLLEDRITDMPGGRILVRTMRAHGAYTALVSGGFTMFTEAVASRLGFDEQRANRLLIENGALTGAVSEPILGAEAKMETLIELREKLDLAPDAVIAVGDGANDLPMLKEAGLGVAFRAKPLVSAAAAACIRHGDLTALLYLQGYSRDEFAA